MCARQSGNAATLAQPGAVQRAAGDRLVDIEVAVADLDVEAALGIGAGPRLEMNCRALAAEIGQRDEITLLALLAFWKTGDIHGAAPHRPASLAMRTNQRDAGTTPS